MNYGCIHNPHCDEGRLFLALQERGALTAAEIRTLTGAGSHTPVISGVRQQLIRENHALRLPEPTLQETYKHPVTGRRCKVYVYRLVSVEAQVAA